MLNIYWYEQIKTLYIIPKLPTDSFTFRRDQSIKINTDLSSDKSLESIWF